MSGFQGRVLVVRGMLGRERQEEKRGDLYLVNYMLKEELEEVLNRSELIVARSGYSTIMDLWALGAKAFFIPTPGQPEQEYLAERMEKKGIAGFCSQQDLSLERILQGLKYQGFKNEKTSKSPIETTLFDVFRNRASRS